ncbi:MAG TPA: autotransporter outer membrane beta-barrel domain-containing protein [Methylothermaceae bacterium]|nr:autotransporter outer membrane beta-barrel domain-containing protein [Methylothermaceae bacterium]
MGGISTRTIMRRWRKVMNKNKSQKRFNAPRALTIGCSLVCGTVVLLTPDWRSQLLAGYDPNNPLIGGRTLNDTQKNMAQVVFEACSQRNAQLEEEFRNRCNALVGAAKQGAPEVEGAIQQASPEQTLSFGIEATRTMAGHVNIVSGSLLGRLSMLRAGLDNRAYRVAGVQLFRNGNPLKGGNAGDDTDFGKIGIWLNTSYHIGDVDSTFSHRGFNFENWGVTAGADYRFTENLVAGGSFSYITSDNDFDGDGGGSNNDSYIGSIYGSYYITDAFYVDGIASYGGINFDITRNIRYAIPGDTVETRARADTNGEQYGFALSTGYQLHWQSLNFTPYLRFSYLGFHVDDYKEKGGNGWGMRFREQNTRSVKTVLGAQTSYAISLPWLVLTPQFRAEWHHEYKDNARNITASFLGDPVAQEFLIKTPKPDRNYATFGVDFAATFAHGASAFVNYEALVGYRNVSSHKIMLGARLDF